MAKKNTMIPMPASHSGGGVLAKVIGGAVVLALLVIVVKHPTDAAGWLKGLIGSGTKVVNGMTSFIRQVAG